MLTFEQLETFRTIVRAGTFSRAAEALFLTQPAISQRVKHLEQVLGVELFYRGPKGRGLRLTPAGERLLQFAEEATRLLDGLREALERERRVARHECITIASSIAPARYLVPRLLTVYHEMHPHVRARVLQCRASHEATQLVLADEAEFGVVSETALDKRLDHALLVRDRLVLVGPRQSGGRLAWPVDGAKGERWPFALPPANTMLRRVAEKWAASQGLEIDVVVESDNYDTVKEAVIQGLALGILSEITVADEVLEGRLSVLPVPGLPRDLPLYLIYNGKRVLSGAAQMLLKLVKDGGWRQALPERPLAAPPRDFHGNGRTACWGNSITSSLTSLLSPS